MTAEQIFFMVWQGLLETLYMVFISTFLAHLVGIPLGVILVITGPDHITENRAINQALGAVINMGRSIPFIILLISLLPFTRWVVGTTIGPTAVIPPLTIGAIPFVARMVENSLKEIPWGVIEAALAMGAGPMQIIRKLLIPEALPSLILGATITTITLIGYSAMAGLVGGGGLGDIAMRYGYYRYETGLMLVVVVVLILLVQVIQMIGDTIARRIDKR
ncbi:MAG: ABC transporter permease [Clostridia bacterium]|jgi:D-methionine transport system permease protein|nr:ABC transporter permease [Clostridia bacterium]